MYVDDGIYLRTRVVLLSPRSVIVVVSFYKERKNLSSHESYFTDDPNGIEFTTRLLYINLLNEQYSVTFKCYYMCMHYIH